MFGALPPDVPDTPIGMSLHPSICLLALALTRDAASKLGPPLDVYGLLGVEQRPRRLLNPRWHAVFLGQHSRAGGL